MLLFVLWKCLFLEEKHRLNTGYTVRRANGESMISEFDFPYTSENDSISVGSQI